MGSLGLNRSGPLGEKYVSGVYRHQESGGKLYVGDRSKRSRVSSELHPPVYRHVMRTFTTTTSFTCKHSSSGMRHRVHGCLVKTNIYIE